MDKLNKNQKAFCREYIKSGCNGTSAYQKVYKCKEDTAKVNASKLLTNANIQKYVRKLEEEIKEKDIVKIEDIISELKAIAFVDRTEITNFRNIEILKDENRTLYEQQVVFTDTDKLSKETKKVVAGYKKTNAGFAIETYDKVKALELLGKYLGMFKDKVEHSGETTITVKMDKETEELAK